MRFPHGFIYTAKQSFVYIIMNS